MLEQHMVNQDSLIRDSDAISSTNKVRIINLERETDSVSFRIPISNSINILQISTSNNLQVLHINILILSNCGNTYIIELIDSCQRHGLLIVLKICKYFCNKLQTFQICNK